MTDLPELLTVAEVAERFKLSAETVRRAIRTERLACYRVLGCTRISPADLAAYLESARCPASDLQTPNSASTAASGASSGGTAAPVAAYQQGRRTQRALDRASRTSKPALSVVQRS